MDKELKQAILLVQRLLKMASISGDLKHTRYLRTALENLQLYKRLKFGKPPAP